MKIGIVGNGINQEYLKEYEDEWELWSVNNLFHSFPSVKFSRWFEIHEFSLEKGKVLRRGRGTYGNETIDQYLDGLNQLGIPVYMRQPRKMIKKSRTFPFEKLTKKYGSYFGCSFAWMIAFALEEGADSIGLFGVALDGNEYYYQRPSVEYMLGLAKGQGKEIYIDCTSQMLRANYAYAYKEDYSLIYALHGELTKELTLTIASAVQKKIDDIWEVMSRQI